jgi:hypothetical protein
MNPGETNIPESLSRWLRIATRDLAPPGPERITREIEAHYAAAVESHLAQGESELDAKAKTVAELGDAHAAAKRFRKTHFTEAEAKAIAKVRNKAGKVRYMILELLVPLGFFIFWRSSLGPPKHPVYFEAGMAALIIFPIVALTISSRRSVQANVPWLIFIGLATEVAIISAMSCTLMAHSPDYFGGYFAIAAVVPRLALRQLHLWNKARKILHGADEYPTSTGHLPA